MRLLPSALMLAAWIGAAPPALAQAWAAYSYPDAGFEAQFPAQPTVGRGAWRTTAGLNAPAAVYAARLDGADYVITVADFADTALEKDAVIADAAKTLSRGGKVMADVEARINTQYGRELTIARDNGDWSMTAVFFFNHRLYVLEGRATGPDARAATSRLIRFQQSLGFPGP